MYGYLSKESPEFPELVCLNKHQYDFSFCTKLWFPKNPCENMGSCLLFWGKKPKNSWCSGFVSTKVCSVCYLHEHKKKKTHDFINRKGSFDRESLVVFWAKLPTKTGIGWKNQEVFCRHDQAEVLFFFLGKNKNRLHSAMVVQFPFRLCWGSWLCWPPISLGWVVVGVWTKMSGQLEGISLEIFFDICSSKLEVSQAFI